jgi:predicted amidophosphoribosyltransferase
MTQDCEDYEGVTCPQCRRETPFDEPLKYCRACLKPMCEDCGDHHGCSPKR